MDYTLYKAINGLSGPGGVDAVFRFLANELPVVIVCLTALLFLIKWPRRRLPRREGAVAATAAAGVALLINQPITHWVDRARPYVAHPGHAHLLISRSHDPSFPSDHATGAFAIATAVWFYDRVSGAVLFGLAALLAFSRVFVGTHYPGDVIAGAAIGAAVALVLRFPPLRCQLERLAGTCSRLWDRMLPVGERVS
jgi:undecaprenyl-diphosphatase